jgi:hypothetical protein
MTSAERERAFIEALDECRARLHAGESLEACLADVPSELHEELRAMLPVTARLEASALDPVPEFMQRLEATLGEAVDGARAARPSRWRRWRMALGRSTAMRAAAMSGVAVVLVLGSGFAVVEASEDALPGQPLYRVKQAREAVELWLARSTTAEIAAYERQLDRRAEELDRVVRDAHDRAVVEDLEQRVAHSVRGIVDRALTLQARGDEGAVARALQELRTMRRRVRDLAASARTEPQLEALARVAAFLRTQELRLRGTDAPLRPTDRQQRRAPSDERSEATAPMDATATRDATATATEHPMDSTDSFDGPVPERDGR